MKRIEHFKSLASVFLLCSFASSVFAFPTAPVNELDEVVQSANAGVTALNDFLTNNKKLIAATRAGLKTEVVGLQTTTGLVKSVIDSLKAAEPNRLTFRKDTRDRAVTDAIAALLKAANEVREASEKDYAVANLEGVITVIPFVASQKRAGSLSNTVAVEFAKLIEETRSQQNALEDKIKALDEQISALKAQVEKLQKIIQAIESLLPKLLEQLSQDSNAQKTKACFTHISQDRTYAAKLLGAVRANLNNAAGLTQYLKNNSPGSGIDVREVKEATGLIVIFRIGALMHCLSTKQQCNGKAYLLTK